MRVVALIAAGALLAVACSDDATGSTGTTDVMELGATDEVESLVEDHNDAFADFDVEAVLAMFTPDGEGISDTPPGRDVYTNDDGTFNPMATTNPIGDFVRRLETVDFAFDSRGAPKMIRNQAGDVYVSYPASWHLTFQDEFFEITAFTVLRLVDTDEGLKVKTHWNLTPQTAISP